LHGDLGQQGGGGTQTDPIPNPTSTSPIACFIHHVFLIEKPCGEGCWATNTSPRDNRRRPRPWCPRRRRTYVSWKAAKGQQHRPKRVRARSVRHGGESNRARVALSYTTQHEGMESAGQARA
ncbi:unnamed protein product, partial [Ectocarpus fasciculatus]